MSAYNIWNPNIRSDTPKVLEFVLTNGDVTGGVDQGKEFIEGLLKDIGIEAQASSWLIEPFRSNYFSEYLDEGNWRDIWQLVWRIQVALNVEVKAVPGTQVAWVNTNATGSGWREEPGDDELVDCIVISDFDSEAALMQAQMAISSDDFKEMRKRYSVGIPTFGRSKTLGKYEQLQINLGKFPEKFYAEGADYAERVIEQCKKEKGTVHFEARH